MKEEGRKKEQENQINVGVLLEKPKEKIKPFNIIQSVSLTILEAFYTEIVSMLLSCKTQCKLWPSNLR